MRKLLLLLLLVPIGGGLALVATIVFLRSGASTRWDEAEAHLVRHRAELVRDARSVIDSQGAPGGAVEPEGLPPSLAIPHLEFAEVERDHLNLIVYTSPDAKSGFRVWAGPKERGFEDHPTAVPFVERFHFNDDYPIGPSNRP